MTTIKIVMGMLIYFTAVYIIKHTDYIVYLDLSMGVLIAVMCVFVLHTCHTSFMSNDKDDVIVCHTSTMASKWIFYTLVFMYFPLRFAGEFVDVDLEPGEDIGLPKITNQYVVKDTVSDYKKGKKTIYLSITDIKNDRRSWMNVAEYNKGG